jgi:hypothetical protein
MVLLKFQKKKVDKILCFRCGKNGHMADACEAVLCVYCERATHVAKDCHLLKMPKPTAALYGLCRNELMIYEVLVSDELIFKHDSGKLGRIRVHGGILSTEQIIEELGWIVPGEHQWCLEKISNNEFKTVFPSKADLSRLVKIVSVPIDANKGLFLTFEEGSATPVDKFKLDEAWVRVSGCPYKLRCDYLALFAVGSLIGKVTEVDMAFTRKHGVVRMHVQVTSLDQIPTGTDHMYDGEGFGITFEVEGYSRPIENESVQGIRDADADDKPQDEGTKKSDLSRDKEIKDKEVRTPKSSLGSQPKSGVAEIKPVQVGSFLLSPNKAQLIVKGNRKHSRESLSWGDRADLDEDLPSPMAFSAPTHLNRFDADRVADLGEDVPFATAEKVQTSPAASQHEMIKALVEIGVLAPVANSILHRFCNRCNASGTNALTL